jgi:1,4-alpha-glucan branching enzyme
MTFRTFVKNLCCWAGAVCLPAVVQAAVTPTISPAFFSPSQSITVTYDVTGTALSSLTDAYAWVWIPNATSIDAKWNVNPASSDPGKTNNAKFTKSIVNGRTLFSLTFVPSTFFSSDISAQKRMGILLKANDWPQGQTSDFLIDFWDGLFTLRVTAPTQQQLFVTPQQTISIVAETPVDASYTLFINEQIVSETSNSKNYSYTHTVTETAGTVPVRLVASTPNETVERTFQYILATNSEQATRPSGIRPGINYHPNDPTKVTLCLLAPLKSSVYAIGDFSDWEINSTYLMKRDGEYFWLEVSGLEPGVEYGFQYLVDQSIRVADPYADKILDPDDQFIPTATYAGLKAYPQQALSSKWYENRVAVLQTNQQPYVWQTTNYTKPPKENLIVYEVLIRDFFEEGQRNYQSLIDTLSYLKRLGINAVQLMPVMEFNGNLGWGYNPTFMFAPDKYYGTKNKLKELVDKCHQYGMAVILDIALNHQDVPNTYAAMYFDHSIGKPAANNPWFNVNAKHPFNVFYDMNHESLYTKDYLDTINHYWLHEFKVDGYRFDLSKGFTQKDSGGDVGGWSAYDGTRVALLKRMADEIWNDFPEAYVILEHLGVNEEERELANYRAAEGKGMMLWGKMTEPYNQITMGYSSNSGISGVYHKGRSWTYPRLVGYMESHDEERLMVKNIKFGNTFESYSAKDEITALKRMEVGFATFLTVPGPKMIWQFGELGYDYSINRCTDGTEKEDCRLSIKPVTWSYLEEEPREQLFNTVSSLLHLRHTYPVFYRGDASFSEGAEYVKQVTIKNTPYTDAPTSTTQMNVQVAVNFGVQKKEVEVSFPHAGIWYNYNLGGAAVTVTTLPHTITMAPGTWYLFTDVAIAESIVLSTEENEVAYAGAYPNPTTGRVSVPDGQNVFSVKSMNGRSIHYSSVGANEIFIDAPAGVYVIQTTGKAGIQVYKIIVQ